MQQLITVSLNDLAFQIEEEGYKALRQYLDRAKKGLRDNPDRDEILGDLERAIAEKCSALLVPGKTIVTSAEVAKILEQVGPVDGAAEIPEPQKESDETEEETPQQYPRRLYRIGENAVLAGVCTGLAAYLGIDVLLVRLIFVGLTIMTSGFGGLIAYIVMVLFVPYAPTSVHRTVAGRTLKVLVATILVLLVMYGIFAWWRPAGGLPGFPVGMPGMGMQELLLIFVILAVVLAVVLAITGAIRSR
jgi:phage shock protein PspC (stress-responsive transcriptional regulator)